MKHIALWAGFLLVGIGCVGLSMAIYNAYLLSSEKGVANLWPVLVGRWLFVALLLLPGIHLIRRAFLRN